MLPSGHSQLFLFSFRAFHAMQQRSMEYIVQHAKAVNLAELEKDTLAEAVIFALSTEEPTNSQLLASLGFGLSGVFSQCTTPRDGPRTPPPSLHRPARALISHSCAAGFA